MTNRTRLQLNCLESRLAPSASVAFFGGNLTITTDHTANNVAITQDASGKLKVNNNAATLGTFAVSGNVTVNAGNGNDTVTVNLFAGKGLSANLSVSTGNGNDLVDLNGNVSGNVTLNGGLGNDTTTSKTSNLSIAGNLFSNDSAGNNSLLMAGKDYTVGGNMILNGVGTFDMGAGSTLKVGGLTMLTAAAAATSGMTFLLNGLETALAGNFIVNGGVRNDVVSITSKITVGGNSSLNIGAGDNTFVLTPAAGGGGLAGHLTYLGGTGIDVVVLGADAAINGNTSVNLGHGINTFVDTPTSVYSGALRLTGGNNTDTMVITGAVSGSLDVATGHGDGNTTVFSGSVGGTFRYRGGNGLLEVLTVAPAVLSYMQMDVSFGSGESTFNLGPNVILGGVVRGSGGSYTFNQGTAILGPNLSFYFYP